MPANIRIGIDAMGGDHGPEVTVPAAIAALQSHDDIQITLVGKPAQIEAQLKQTAKPNRLIIKAASEVVDMDESPAVALKQKKDSSMRVALNALPEGELDAVVSAGNTGALMATSRFVCRMIKGVDRPAICTAMPGESGHTHMLDLGANVDSGAEQLLQFAHMGAILTQAIDEVANPTIALLNIGEEAIKGNEQVKAANTLLKDSGLNYIGYVEGDALFKGELDVIVCDGFVGNVALKTSEGLAKLFTNKLRTSYTKSLWGKFAAVVAYPVLRHFRQELDPRRYNGASLLGLQHVVVKSHGGADKLAFANAISIARKEVIKKVPQKIAAQMVD